MEVGLIPQIEFHAAANGSAAGVMTSVPESKVSPSSRRVRTNDKITLGVIGLAGRGFENHVHEFHKMEDVEITAVCDVHQPHLDRAVEYTGGRAKPFHDFRDLLALNDLDAVVVATPPHWHALISILACKAGKDVYCEKPMSRYPVEAQRMAAAAEKYECVTQVGTQIHATANYHKCVDVVRSGALGTITSVTNFCCMNNDSEGLGYPSDSEPLPGLDWDFWLGPAPKVPFNIGRFRNGMHRYFKDYADSWLHELGSHVVDLPVWALELDQPIAVSAGGGRFATNSIADVPDTLNVIWEYPNMTMTWTLLQHSQYNFGAGGIVPGRGLGNVFHGKEATLISDYGICKVVDKNGITIDRSDYPVSVPPSPGHEREFIECIKTRSLPSCSFQAHLPLHVAINLAHTSLATGRKLHWDAEKFEVIGDIEATRLTVPEYRAPWVLPEV